MQGCLRGRRDAQDSPFPVQKLKLSLASEPRVGLALAISATEAEPVSAACVCARCHGWLAWPATVGCGAGHQQHNNCVQPSSSALPSCLLSRGLVRVINYFNARGMFSLPSGFNVTLAVKSHVASSCVIFCLEEMGLSRETATVRGRSCAQCCCGSPACLRVAGAGFYVKPNNDVLSQTK